MSLLPLPSRLPARKHVMAGVFAMVGLGLMFAAVLTASGLGSPFRARGPESVRTGAVLVNEPSATTTPVTTPSGAPAGGPNKAVAPVSQGPNTTAPKGATPTTAKPAPTTTTSPLPVQAPSTTVPNILGSLGKSLSSR